MRALSAGAVPCAFAVGCEKQAPAGAELSRGECVQMVIRVNELRNAEMGRVNDADRRRAVDGCMEHGTRAQLECVNHSSNARELSRCDELAK